MEMNVITPSANDATPGPRGQPLGRLGRGFAACALGFGLSACAVAAGAAAGADRAPQHAAAPTASATGPLSAADMLARIRIEIGKPTCTTDSQCRSLPIGHKACGGPEGHLAWSTALSNEARLLAWAGEYTAARRREVEARGMMSNCQVVADPGAVCRQGRCVSGGIEGATPVAR
jgi:hypothetical protein